MATYLSILVSLSPLKSKSEKALVPLSVNYFPHR